MTHARKKGSLGQYRGEGRGQVEGWSHGETVGGAWPAHEGKAKKDMAKKVKTRNPEHTETCVRPDSKSQRRSKRTDETTRGKPKRVTRKLYPLRGRAVASDSEALSCHVLLTRLDEQEEESKACEVDPSKKTPKSHKKRKKSLQESIKTDIPSAQEPRKRRLASLNAEAVNSLLLEKSDGPSGAKLAKKQASDGSSTTEPTKTCSNPKKRASKSEMCQNLKQVKTDKSDDAEVSLYAPAPRRLAGLNAAALLKLTSSTTANKQRVSKSDSKSVCGSGKQAVRCKTKAQTSKKQSRKPEGACEVCKSRSFESSPDSRSLTKPGYQSRSILGYPLKVVKEEQVEAELSPYCCCPPEGSVEYCHRLALFLGQEAYSEAEETPVKHECLVPAHPALTLSAHPCMCADPCYSGYYVHIAHPGPPAASLSTQALPCTHSPFCPRGLSGSKLLTSSGIPHPAFCGSVGSACYRQPCGVGRYTFSAVQPVTTRTCSFPTSCSNCSHPIKTEGFSSSQDEHSRALLVPPALPISGCPSIPRVNPSSPRLLSSMSDRRQAEVRLKVGKECPQNTKPSNSSLTMGHARLSKQPSAAPASAKHPRKVGRRQATNGWRPVGVPTEKEVFIAGDDETVLRQCYEGVERDGEVIRVRDTVLLRSGPRKKSLPYVAKISALWEDPRTGEMMMSLFWYYRPEHTQGGRDPSMHCENEIFASRHQDENSVACIEDRCYVLPLAQYCRFCALVKRRSEGVSESTPVVPGSSDGAVPPHRLVPDGVDPELVYLCRHVYDFRYGRTLKNPQ